MFNKSDILANIQRKSLPNEKLDKQGVLSLLNNRVEPKTNGKSAFLNALPRNKDLANKTKGITFESRFGTQKTTMKSLVESIVFESSKNTVNPIRLDLKSLAVSNLHSKFTINRGPDSVIVEMMYPNVNNEVTIKIINKNGNDKLVTIDPEDPSYQENFGAVVLKEIDKVLLANKSEKVDYKLASNDASLGGSGDPAPVLPALGGYAPVWESAWLSAMALVEADDLDVDMDAAGGESDTESDVEPGDVNADGDNTFGAEDFSADSTSGGDMFSGDFGGSGSLSSLGGGMVGGGGSGSGSMGGGVADAGGEPEGEYLKFRDKDDWTQSSLDTMQKLTAEATAEQMQNGNGVVLSSNDVLKGTVGIENDSNYQIVDKFLKIYPELDEIDIPEEMMNEIEDKLDKNDNQFDAFLQQNLSKITGTETVDNTLNNEMFDDFKPMGGEQPKEQKSENLNNEPKSDSFGDLDSFFDLDVSTDVEDDSDGFDLDEPDPTKVNNEDEFPNLS